MAQRELEHLRELTREIAAQHPQGRTAAAARAIGGRVDRLLRDRRFLDGLPDEGPLRRNLDRVHAEIDRTRRDDPGRLGRYLEDVDGWAASLAGDSTTPPPDSGP